MPVFDRIFLSPADGLFVALQWRLALRGRSFAGEAGASALAAALRQVARSDNAELVRQATEAGARVLAYDSAISRNEERLEAELDSAYGLTAQEKAVLDRRRA
jgi:hypothetical protein